MYEQSAIGEIIALIDIPEIGTSWLRFIYLLLLLFYIHINELLMRPRGN